MQLVVSIFNDTYMNWKGRKEGNNLTAGSFLPPKNPFLSYWFIEKMFECAYLVGKCVYNTCVTIFQQCYQVLNISNYIFTCTFPNHTFLLIFADIDLDTKHDNRMENHKFSFAVALSAIILGGHRNQCDLNAISAPHSEQMKGH